MRVLVCVCIYFPPSTQENGCGELVDWNILEDGNIKSADIGLSFSFARLFVFSCQEN